MPAKKIFISYCHQDLHWLKIIETHLKPLLNQQLIKIWHDKHIKPGDIWQDQINIALQNSDLAILLVSPDFLASDFIMNKELPYLIKAHQKRQLTLFWLPVRASLFTQTSLKNIQAAYDPSRPLSTLTADQIDQAMVDMVSMIKHSIDDE